MICLGVLNESEMEGRAGETRVAMTPDLIKRLTKTGIRLHIQTGAGSKAGHSDQSYREHGAVIEPDESSIWSGSEVIAMVGQPTVGQIAQCRSGTVLLSMLQPLGRADLVRACAEAGVTALSYDLVPRISRAQSVDVLSAMASIAGYKAVLLAAAHLPRMFPMMMTAAGTITASKVFVIGAGVAGLQAIATAKRLGALVEAFDVRPAVKEQVESLGARFVAFHVATGEGSGGYAAEQSGTEQDEQRRQMKAAVTAADVVITTAAIPGKPAPKLIDDEMVHAMKQGSVIVDLAAETGGNCSMTRKGTKVTSANGVTIIGLTELAATIPFHASQMFARIVLTLVGMMADQGELKLNPEDEVLAGMVITHAGRVCSERIAKAHHMEYGAWRNAAADRVTASAVSSASRSLERTGSCHSADSKPSSGANGQMVTQQQLAGTAWDNAHLQAGEASAEEGGELS